MMNRISLKVKLIIAFLLSSLAAEGFSNDVGRGGYAGASLRMGLGARAMAMGGGSAALVDDGYAGYYNPAGIPFLSYHRFTATLNSMALDRHLFYVGYSQSMGGRNGLMKAGFSAGWLCTGVDQIDARDFNGNSMGTLSNWENCFFFSFALNPAPLFSLGFSGKLLYNRFPGITEKKESVSAVGLGFDVGVIVKPLRHVVLGLSFRDLGAKYSWNTQKLWERGTETVDTFPRVLSGGVVLEKLFGCMTFLFDLNKVEYQPLAYAAGTEIELYKRFFLRAGIRDSKLTFGGGCQFELFGKITQYDYGFVPDPVAPRGNHVFTWSFIF